MKKSMLFFGMVAIMGVVIVSGALSPDAYRKMLLSEFDIHRFFTIVE